MSRCTEATEPAYGDRLWPIWRQDLRDRLQGNAARANARWGFLTPPPGRGRLIWVKAGARRDDVLLGAETVRALREKRLDIRVALTFERDYPDLLRPRLAGLRKVAVAYGPSDTPAAVRRVLRRLAPLGVIYAGGVVPSHLNRALSDGRHTLALNADAGPGQTVEAAYPASPGQAQIWAGQAKRVAPPAALLTLLVESQVDPNFKTVVTGGAGTPLWWWQGLALGEIRKGIAEWRASDLPPGILFLGPFANDIAPVRTAVGAAAIMLSAWDRTPLAPGSVVLIDEWRWLPAIAAASTAAHLAHPGGFVFWQALAGGCPLSFSGRHLAQHRVNEPVPADMLVVPENRAQLFSFWSACAREPMMARRHGDYWRRVFWAERRRATAAADDLLARVYDW